MMLLLLLLLLLPLQVHWLQAQLRTSLHPATVQTQRSLSRFHHGSRRPLIVT
jgi:hypothetical protein